MRVRAMYRRSESEVDGLVLDRINDWPVTRLGLTGMEFQCGDDFEFGENLSVSIHLPETRNFVIANGEVVAVQDDRDKPRVAVQFDELPAPLERRIQTIMQRFGAQEAEAESPADEPQIAGDPEYLKELAGRLSELQVDMEAYLDILELFAAGINLDDFTPEFQREPLAGPGSKDDVRMPMFELSPAGLLKLNAAGEPAGEPTDYLQVPGTDAAHCFGCKCTSRIDLGHGLVSSPGTIFVFSYEEFPEDNNIVLCPLGAEAMLGRVYLFNRGNRVVLEPSDPSRAPIVLDCPIQDSGYRLIARYEYF